MQIDYDGNNQVDTTIFDVPDASAEMPDPPSVDATPPAPDDKPEPTAPPVLLDTYDPPPPISIVDTEHDSSSAVVNMTSAALHGDSSMDPSAIAASVSAARSRFGLTLDDTGSDVESIIHLAGGDPALVTQATIDRFVNAKYPTWAAPTQSHGGRGGDADINYDGIADTVQSHVTAATTADTYDGVADWLTPAQIAALIPAPTPQTTAPAPRLTTTTTTGGGNGPSSQQPITPRPLIRVMSGPGLLAPTAAGAAASGPSWVVPAALAAGLLKLIGAF